MRGLSKFGLHTLELSKKHTQMTTGQLGRLAIFPPSPVRALSQRSETSPSSERFQTCFVHTPMASVEVQGRERFWTEFDKRYYAVHPGLKPANAGIWELPHWMPWLAGVLQAEGFENKALNPYSAVDYKTGIDEDFIVRELRNNPSDTYLFSPMTPNLHLAYAIAGLVKKTHPHSKTIFGGVIATPLHQELAKHPQVDYVVFGRGETALPALLTALKNKEGLEKVGQLSYKNNAGEVVTNLNTYPMVHPENLAFPKYDLFPKTLGEELRYIRQNYALGCPFRCSFCTIQTIGMKPNYFPVARVLAEIKAYRSHYGEYHNIYFGDETFTLNKERTLVICKALKEAGNITYDMQTRLTNLHNKEVLMALQESGCKWVEVGIETLVQQSLNFHKQGTNISQLRETLRKLRDLGLPVCSFIINGLPDQTPDDMRRSIDILCKLLDEKLLHASYFFGLVPYPGSLMYKNPAKFGLKINHNDFSLYNEDLLPVYDTPHATAEQIYEVFLEGVSQIGEAMSSKPYLGQEIPEDFLAQCGKSLTHV